MLKRLGLYLLLPITTIIVVFKSIIHFNTNESFNYKWDASVLNESGEVANLFDVDGLHRGMSVFGWQKDNAQAIDELIKANIEWVAVVPFIYQENETSPKVSDQRNEGEFTKRDSTLINVIRQLHKKGLKVHLKPHVWLGEGWRSILKYSKEGWQEWFASYRNRMLSYAKMAQLTNTELFCVGTELKTSIKNQPEAWEQLIRDIRKIYDGQLTYAANWHDEYEHITFWNQLDFIGIQAYFPLTKNKSPDLESIKKGWQPHLKALTALSNKHNKPILFTEVGYRSDISATVKPWEWDDTFGVLYKKKSDKTQQLAFEALFQEVWNQPWFAGLYIWEWNTQTKVSKVDTNLNFSPRFKPAEQVIAKWFGQTKSTSK